MQNFVGLVLSYSFYSSRTGIFTSLDLATSEKCSRIGIWDRRRNLFPSAFPFDLIPMLIFITEFFTHLRVFVHNGCKFLGKSNIARLNTFAAYVNDHWAAAKSVLNCRAQPLYKRTISFLIQSLQFLQWCVFLVVGSTVEARPLESIYLPLVLWIELPVQLNTEPAGLVDSFASPSRHDCIFRLE